MTTLHIFPSLATAEAFNRSVLDRGGILCGTPAITLKRLSEIISEATAGHGRMLSPIGTKLLLTEIIQRRYEETKGYFAGLRDFQGFVDALDSMIGELKQARIAADSFEAYAVSLPRSAQLVELASLYAGYTRLLDDRGLLDAHDCELAALACLQRENALPPIFNGVTAVTVHDVYDFSEVQIVLLAALSRLMPVELRLPYNPANDRVYAYVTHTADAVEALDNSELDLSPTFAEPEGTFLTPLLQAVFGDADGHPIVPPGSMALVTAPGPYRECEEIGRRIRKLLESGVDPAGIAVLFRTLHGYEPMFEDVCRRFRIPISFRRGAPLATAPLVRAALAPFAVIESRFAREELLALCTCSYLDIVPARLSADELYDVLIGSGYVNETLGSVEERIGRLVDRLRAKGMSSTKEERVRRALLPLLADLRSFGESAGIARFADLLEGFIIKYRIYHRGISGEGAVLKRDASSITLLQKLLLDLRIDSAALGLADRKVTPENFLRLLHQGMEGVSLSGERSSGVAVMNFHDARGGRFPHVFIGGLNEEICPQHHDSHPLFKDSDKVLIRRLARCASLRTGKEKGEEEILLFWLAIACAEKSLTLSCCYSDSRGNGMLRSPFLDDLLARVELKEERCPVSRIVPEPEKCRDREELLNSLSMNHIFELPVDSAAPLRDSLARAAANGRIEEERELFFTAEILSERTALAHPHTGLLAAPGITAELKAFFESADGSRFSPTSLEEYGACPFRYFLRRLLRIAPAETPGIDLESRDVGSLAHLILKKFFQRMQQEGALPIRDTATPLALLREEAARAFHEWEAEHHTGDPLLWELEKENLLPLLERVVEMEAAGSEFIPQAFELEIDPPYEVLDDADGRIRLTGKMDRVDVDSAGERLRIVDYKLAGSGARYQQLLKKDAMGETSFQMPVYLLAAARILAEESGRELTSHTACYWLLRKAGRIEKDLGNGGKENFADFLATDPAQRAALGEDNFLNRLCAKVQAMKRGDFQITPRDCGVCDFSGICRYVEVSLGAEARSSSEARKRGSAEGISEEAKSGS